MASFRGPRRRLTVGLVVAVQGILAIGNTIGFSSWTSAQWPADYKEPTGQGSRHRQNAPNKRMQTKDGYLMVGPLARQSGRAVLRRSPGMVRGPAFCHQPEPAVE